MRRWQLFEFEDQAWLPAFLRDSVTDILRYYLSTAQPYAPAAACLRTLLMATGCTSIVDFGSGAGGPLVHIQRQLAQAGCPVRVTLTDKYPHSVMVARIQSLELQTLRYHPTSVDATHMPADLHGIRTFFSCFHHFAPLQASAILQRAVADHAGIAVFEFTARSRANVLGMLLAPLAVLAQAPAIFRQRPARLFWVYVLPLIPLIYWWDGIVSYLRSYSVAELEQLSARTTPGVFRWEAGTLASEGGAPPITYLLGWPADSATTSRP